MDKTNLLVSRATYQPYVSHRAGEQGQYWGMAALIRKRNCKAQSTNAISKRWNEMKTYYFVSNKE
jgi:hypothetical protein